MNSVHILRGLNMGRRAIARLGGILLLSTGAAGPLPTFAADTGPAATNIEEMVITARRRDDTLFESPVSASVIDQTQLRNLRLNNIADMMKLVPNATVPTDAEGLNTFIVIRGIRQPDPPLEPNLGFCVD